MFQGIGCGSETLRGSNGILGTTEGTHVNQQFTTFPISMECRCVGGWEKKIVKLNEMMISSNMMCKLLTTCTTHNMCVFNKYTNGLVQHNYTKYTSHPRGYRGNNPMLSWEHFEIACWLPPLPSGNAQSPITSV